MIINKKLLKISVVFVLTLTFIPLVNVNGTGVNSQGEVASPLLNSNLHQSGWDDGIALCSEKEIKAE